MELNKKTLRNLFLGAAGCIVLYWLLHETERLTSVVNAVWGIVSPFVIGAAIAFILNVPMRAIEKGLKGINKSGLRRGVALILTMLAVILVLTGVVYLLLPQLAQTVESILAALPGFFNKLQQKISEYLAANPELMSWLVENTDYANVNWSDLIQNAISLVSNSVSSIVDKAFNAVVTLGNGVFDAVLSIVFALYCLGRKEILAGQGRRLLYAFVPEKAGDEVVRVARMTNSTFSNFISGQCVEALILGAMFAITMPIFKMPYVPLVSVVISVTALIPIVGAFVGCAIGAFFILVLDPTLALWFVVLFLVLQQIEGNLIYPRVVGTSIGLPGMWVLVAVAFGGDLMGVGGMLLMIPLASVLYALIREITNNRLDQRQIQKDKLIAQPPELKSNFKEKREQTKQKRNLKKMMKNIAKKSEDAEE